MCIDDRAISVCIDTIIKSLEHSIDFQMTQMIKLPWSTMDTVGDQSDYVSQILDIIKNYVGVVGKIIANRRYYRTFNDRFAEYVKRERKNVSVSNSIS